MRFRNDDKGTNLLSASVATKSFGDNLSNPFVPYYLARLNATVQDLGWFQALNTLLPNVFQLPWSYASDKTQKRLPFIIVGTVISSLTLFSAIFVTDIPLLILIFAVNALALSMIAPTWSALLGDKVKHGERGRAFSGIMNFSMAAGIIGSIAALVLLSAFPPKDAGAFRLPFVVASLFGLGSLVFLWPIKERESNNNDVKLLRPRELDRDFRKLVLAQVAYNFFMAMGWPLFYITLANVLGASNVDIALLTFVGTASTIAFQPVVGRLIDRTGPTGLMTLSRFLLVSVPFAYGMATAVYQLYFLNVLTGIAMAIINVAFSAYILDVSPPSSKAEYFAYYNLFVGVAGFVGSLSGGFLAAYFQVFWALPTALLAVYVICGTGRLFTAFLFLRVKDVKKYPSTPRQVAASVLEKVRKLWTGP